MTVRIRLIALVIVLLGTGSIAASPDPTAPRTPHESLGLLKAATMIDRSILATIEYGAEHLHIPLLVVMGHES
jgi:hypothetical protein